MTEKIYSALIFFGDNLIKTEKLEAPYPVIHYTNKWNRDRVFRFNLTDIDRKKRVLFYELDTAEQDVKKWGLRLGGTKRC